MARQGLDSEFSGTERFDVVRTLGSGAMGVVFAAIDRQRDVRVALKTLRHLDPHTLYRFKREFRALHDIHHPNLVRIDELVEDEGHWFFTMELVPGVDFLTYVRGAPGAAGGSSEDTLAGGPRGRARLTPADAFPDGTDPSLPPVRASSPGGLRVPLSASVDLPRLRAVLGQLANGLSALHEAGKVHRDIKPANVLVTPQGKAVLLDFGVVADAFSGIGETEGVFVGTVAYMAPEQAAGHGVGPPADWYALGSMLYEALTDRLPFDGSTLQVAMDKQRDEPRPPSSLVRGIPRDLDALCLALLRRDPEERAGRLAVLRCAGIQPPPAVAVRAETSSAWPMVGRDAELAALRAAYEEVAGGSPVTMLVTGESGIGKSALIRELAESLAAGAAGQVAVLRGRCYERESVPYKALDGVIDALAHFLRGLPDVDAAALLPPSAALLRRVFPVLGGVESIARAPMPRREIQDPLELRQRAFTSLRQLLQLVSERYRTIITIDDLQWADADSLLLLQDLLCPPEPPALLLLTSVRTDAAGTLPAPVLHLPGEVRRIDLRMLEQPAAERLAAMLLHQYRVAHVDASHVAAETAGHPLYLGELVRHLATEGSRATDLPRLDDAIWGRVLHLSAVARAVLELVCLAGGPLPRETARRAAELDERTFADQVALLRVGHFIRGTQATSEGLEPYHDRVRECVVRLMEPARRDVGLQRLAFALGTAVGASEQPDLLLYHLQLIGDTERAAELAVSAAERAASALAFDRAAELYYAAIQLGELVPARRRELTYRLAKTLVLAGRGLEAAAMFERAADGADPVTRLECLRLAAEQLLRSGHLDEGIEQLRTLLAEVGLPYPSTPRRALISLKWQRARLRLRGRRWTLRSPREISDRELLDADLCTSIGQSLGWVDNIRGAAFQTRGLRLALDLGEPIRLGRALGSEAAYQASLGGRGAERGAVLCAELQALAEQTKVQYLAIFGMIIEGTCRYFAGAFADAVRTIREAEVLSQEVGAMYEIAQARLPRLRSLRMLGAFTDMGEMFDVFVRDAERRGDRYSETNLRRCCSLLFLARDDVAGAEHNLELATWSPPGPAFHVQHWFELEARAEIALYEGADAATLDALSASLAAADASLLTRVQTVRVVSTWLLGRLLLAAAQPARPGARRALRRWARRLRRESVPYAGVFARLLDAGIATCVDPTDDAAALWRRAAADADAADMRVIAACARWRAGQLTSGDQGAALIHQAEAELLAAGVRRPDRFVEVCASGGPAR